jgi:hypothetical protein
VVILLMVITGYSVNGYWWLFYQRLLLDILLMTIGGYSIKGYYWIFY